MTRRWKITMWIAGGLVLAGLGGWGAVANLDAANKIASVVSAVVGVVGLYLSGYGIVLARRGAPPINPHPSPGAGGDTSGDVHQRTRAGRDAYTAGRDQHFGAGGPGSR